MSDEMHFDLFIIMTIVVLISSTSTRLRQDLLGPQHFAFDGGVLREAVDGQEVAAVDLVALEVPALVLIMGAGCH